MGPVSTEKKNWGIPSEIMVAVVAQPVSTIPGSLPNYTFGNQGCSGCSTGFNRKKKFGYTFGNQGCSGCSTSFNQKKIWVYLRKSGLQWMLNLFQPFLDLFQTIPSEIRVAVVAQPVSTKKKFGYTFENQGCSGCSTSFNHSWISPKLYLRKSGLQWLLNRSQTKKKLGYTFENQGCSGCSTSFNRKKNRGIPSKIMVAVVAQPVSTEKKIGVYLRKSGLQWLLNRFQPFLDLCSGCSTGFNRK